jgi:hypothetical protein
LRSQWRSFEERKGRNVNKLKGIAKGRRQKAGGFYAYY